MTKSEERARKKAYLYYNLALFYGDLVRGPCEVCGSTRRIVGHHADYKKPLQVQWLCGQHHAAAHGKKIREEKRKPETEIVYIPRAYTPSLNFPPFSTRSPKLIRK